MRAIWVYVLISLAAWAQAQSVPEGANTATSHISIADFGLVYPLSNDWVRATKLLQRKVESSDPAPNFDVLLAAVYVPKSNLSGTSPFFSVYAYRQSGADCKKSFEAMIAHSQDKNARTEGVVKEFSAAGRDYFRVDFAHGLGGRHQCMICTAADGRLLIWNAGASNEKGIDAIVNTLNSIAPLPQQTTERSQWPGLKGSTAGDAPLRPDTAQPERVKVSSGITNGLLIKKVNPVYPADARASYIQGTVMLRAEISKTGDITDLELVDGPIELAGSAVAAVRQWKYRPYLLMGQPVAVDTQIQVNYQLQR
jgi:TonB family protein